MENCLKCGGSVVENTQILSWFASGSPPERRYTCAVCGKNWEQFKVIGAAPLIVSLEDKHPSIPMGTWLQFKLTERRQGAIANLH